jgi:hypothetical protein
MSELSGFYEGMDFESYAGVDALNGSRLLHIKRSPMKYKHELDNPTPATPAMILGVATHRLILEPDKVGDFAVWGERDEEKVRRGKVWDAFQEQHKGQQIVTVDERDAMVGMGVGARKNLPIMKYVNAKGPTEVSMFWRDPFTGRRMKGRVDKIIPSTHTIVDLKTTRDCHSFQFGKQSYALGYHIKMAMYWNAYQIITGKDAHLKLLAIESKPPHESTVFRVTKDVILQGLQELQELMTKLAECERNDYWPAEHEDETDLMLPAWAVSQDDLAEFAEAEA